jgi:hypothetical protein
MTSAYSELKRINSMKIRILVALVLLFIVGVDFGYALPPPIIILKADDLKNYVGYDPTDVTIPPVSLEWQRFVDFIEFRGIKASIGIICNSLAGNDQKYFDYITSVAQRGFIEFWNHGLTHEKWENNNVTYYEFQHTSYEFQKSHLETAQELATNKLSLTLAAFGAPFNRFDNNTARALREFPDIEIWLLGGTGADKEVLGVPSEGPVRLEYGFNNPDCTQFKADYEDNLDLDYIVLQAHPGYWDQAKFDEFVCVINYLTQEGATFMTPSEYVAGNTNSTNLPPIANAGPDSAVIEGETGTLDGSNSSDPDDATISYQWTQIGGIPVTLSDPTSAKPTFVTPIVSTGEMILTFEVVVKDDDDLQDNDQVTVTVNDNGIDGFPDDVLTMICSTGKEIGIKVESGGDLVSITAVEAATVPDSSDKPENLPYDLFDLLIKTDAVGGTAKVTFYLESKAGNGDKWSKYKTSTGVWEDCSAYAVFNAARDEVTHLASVALLRLLRHQVVVAVEDASSQLR